MRLAILQPKRTSFPIPICEFWTLLVTLALSSTCTILILVDVVENRKIEEVEELPIFADGVSTAISRYEAVFEPVHRNLDHGI